MNADEVRVDILKKEIDIISQKINHFDNLRLKTRQMAIVLWVAVIGFGLKNSDLQYSGFLYCLASFIPLPFWYTESTYRRYYKGWSGRFKAIRKFIRDGEYLLPNDTIARYKDFIDATMADADFPLFDYWAHKTIEKETRKSLIDKRKSLFSPIIFWIYFPMALIGGVLSVFKLHGFLFIIFLFALCIIFTVVMSFYIKTNKKKDKKKAETR